MTFQVVFNLCVFFDGPRANKWLRHRFWYALYEYNLIFTNTLVGIAIMFTRSVMWMVSGMFCLGRIDLTLLPGPGQLEFADFSYRCYIAMVRQDHRYNNPVCVVFFDILTDHLIAFRRKRAPLYRRHFRLTWQLGVALSALRDRIKPEHDTGTKSANRSLMRANVQHFIMDVQGPPRSATTTSRRPSTSPSSRATAPRPTGRARPREHARRARGHAPQAARPPRVDLQQRRRAVPVRLAAAVAAERRRARRRPARLGSLSAIADYARPSRGSHVPRRSEAADDARREAGQPL